MIIAGEFNAKLKPHPGKIGHSTPHPSTHDKHDQELQTQGLNLCAINAWHESPHHTFNVTPVRSQIDYLLIQREDSEAQAKHTIPLVAGTVPAPIQPAACQHWAGFQTAVSGPSRRPRPPEESTPYS